MPKKTATPIARRISAPAPSENTSGTTPMMNAKEVIKIGRSLSRCAASLRGINRGQTMDFQLARKLHDQDLRSCTRDRPAQKPICVKMLFSPPVSHTPVMAENRHIGTIIEMGLQAQEHAPY